MGRLIGKRHAKRRFEGRLSEDEAFANAVSTLYANIGFMGTDGPLRTIVVTSAVPDEGKSTIAVGLARVMAASGKRVILLECDPRRRSLARLLDVQPAAGWGAVVMGDVELRHAIARAEEGGPFLLDAEPDLPSPADLLDSSRFRSLLGLLRRSYDYVVIDTPPVGMFVDAAVIASHADATVMVVREGFARQASVIHAFDQLKQAGANVVGVAMSFCGGSSRRRSR